MKNDGRRYPLVYYSPYDGDYAEEVEANEANARVIRGGPVSFADIAEGGDVGPEAQG